MIQITGQYKSKADLVAEVVDWFCKRFDIDTDAIELHVKLVRSISPNITADVVQMGEDYQFRMRIAAGRGISKYRLIDRTMHELVHVRQYHTGAMKQNHSGDVLFKGAKYKLSEYETEEQLPWEIEARGEEHNLSYDFCKSKGDDFLKRTIPSEVIKAVFS